MASNTNKDLYGDVEFATWLDLQTLFPEEIYLIRKYLQQNLKTVEAGTNGGRILLKMQEMGFANLAGFDYSTSGCYGVHLIIINLDILIMKASSLDLREKIVIAYFLDKMSIRQTAAKFSVAKSLVQKLVKQQRTERNLEAKKPGKPQISYLTTAEPELREIVRENHDATLAELCEIFAGKTGNWVGKSAMCSALQRIGLNRKKKLMDTSNGTKQSVKYFWSN